MRITLFCFAQVNSTKFNWSEEFSLLSTVRVSDWTMIVWELFLLPHPPGPHPCENAFSWPPRRFAPSSGWFFFSLKKKTIIITSVYVFYFLCVCLSVSPCPSVCHKLQCRCKTQRTIYRCLRSPPTTCILGIQISWSGMAAGPPSWASSLVLFPL